MLKQIFSQFSVVGFSGARRAPDWSLDAMSSAASSVSSGCSVRVGCANGVDLFFRDLPLAVSSAYRFPRAQVFSVAGHHRSDFAARSIACVKSVADDAGLWVCFPSSACPPSLIPSSRSSRCFYGSGSGTWASLALAVGLGVPCLVYLGELSLPVGWSISPVAGCPGWFSSGLAAGSLVASSPVVQLSLF
ncbi:hypothetical protein HW132_31020 [Brasilonema sp. CT11]|nr:hypothetical protein [Brasilonema sp. CT11]